ncbi:multidrug resistance-associated protein 1-like [Ictidomys tridecemlineatus]|nr:multidrug resistance-associated protein 1-like [Ictidomys tridecemlineatus]
MKIPEGAFVAIVGQVGSGKSSVLSAILGEMQKLTGVVQRKGSVAYVSQQAWIQNCILQENILFGSIMQKQFYERILEACALLPDLEQLPNGDQTEIGERGVNISGGQKQRVSLARAVYSGADIYLLDDPLSAVDVHVGKQLFEKVIGSSGLLKNKTRILVTHNLTLLPHVDFIVVMESGRVAQMGTYQELLSKTQNIHNLLQVFSGQEEGLFVCFGACVLTRGSLSASRTLYAQLLSNVLHLPLQYFETNPIGQIINRFTKDMFIIDIRFHYYLRTWLNYTLDVIGTILVILGAFPLFILGIIPLVFLYFTIQRYYIASSRQIRRLSGASRSPVISHFSETLLGVSTIRAFGHEQRFIQQNREVVNENLVCFYNNVISNRWLSVRLEFLGNLMLFFTALLAVLAGNSIDSAIVGLSISYALNITQSLNFWVRKACEIETNAVSIERVCEYEDIDKEAPWIMSRRPPLQWPNKGVVEFINYQARYRDDLGLALEDITFQTNGEEKIGIVGRTGAGKSTLSNSLFRIVERSGGKIIIDGIDISTIGLHDLRGRLNIIPQDPVLFSGTLQMNLDPLDNYSDSELWEVLELCHLKEFVQSLPKKLLHEISEGGENLSVGQRQLLCLARALLRKTKILILDEATASIDFETDNLVQNTIRKEFSDCTILTIAHRLHSIFDSDRVLVLDSGRIIEFGAPQNLIHQKGLFFRMTTEAGMTQDLGTKDQLL